MDTILGVLCMGFGLAMVVCGKHYIFWSYRLAIFAIFFGTIYGLLPNILPEVGAGVTIGLGVCAAAFTYCRYWPHPSLFIAMMGFYLGLFIVSLADLKGFAKFCTVIPCAFALWLYSMCKLESWLDDYVKYLRIATAACGSGLLCIGIAITFFDKSFTVNSWSLYAFLFGGAVVAYGGSVLQRKLYGPGEGEFNEDEVDSNDVVYVEDVEEKNE